MIQGKTLSAGQKYPTFEHSRGVPCIDYADLPRGQERHLRTASAVQYSKYGQIRTESRLSRVTSRHHLTFTPGCSISLP